MPDNHTSLLVPGHVPPPGSDLERHDEQRLQAAERSDGAEVKKAKAAGNLGAALAAICLMYSNHLLHATRWPKKAADKYAAEYPNFHAIDSLLQWATTTGCKLVSPATLTCMPAKRNGT